MGATCRERRSQQLPSAAGVAARGAAARTQEPPAELLGVHFEYLLKHPRMALEALLPQTAANTTTAVKLLQQATAALRLSPVKTAAATPAAAAE